MYAYQKYLEFQNFCIKINLHFLPIIFLIALLASTLHAQAQSELDTPVPPQIPIAEETLPANDTPSEALPSEEDPDTVDSPEPLPEEPSVESSTEQYNSE